MLLTQQQIDFFQQQGYLILREFTAADSLAHLRTIAQVHLSQKITPLEYEADVHYPGAPTSRSAPGGDTIRRLLQAAQRDPAFLAWGQQASLVQVLRQLFSKKMINLVQNHHNCIMAKQPEYSSTTLWHQDFRYWNYAQNRLITTWLALGSETPNNGCMRLIPGSHKMKFSTDRFDDEQFFRIDMNENRQLMHQSMRAELAAGDVLLFHSGLLHAAGRNHTNERKLALVYTYRSEDNLPLEGSHSARLDDLLC